MPHPDTHNATTAFVPLFLMLKTFCAIWQVLFVCMIAALPLHEAIAQTDTVGEPTSSLHDARGVLSPRVIDVQVGGWWQIEDRRGQYRAVVLAEAGFPAYHRLFLQWLALDNRGLPTEVIKEHFIKEATHRRGVVVRGVRFEKDNGTWKLDVARGWVNDNTLFDKRYATTATGELIRIDTTGIGYIPSSLCGMTLLLGAPGRYEVSDEIRFCLD